jgi:hypothetical protein
VYHCGGPALICTVSCLLLKIILTLLPLSLLFLPVQWLFEEDTDSLVDRSRVRKNAGLWQEYYDDQARTEYYYNVDTAESQFQPPPDFLLDWIETKEQENTLESESISGRTGGPWEEFTLVRPHIFTDNVRQEKSEAREKYNNEHADEAPFPLSDTEEDTDPIVYYRHFERNELRVQEPEDFKEQHRMGSLRSSGRVLPRRQVNGRIELMDSRTGNIFYFDRQDRIYSWDKPIGFDDVWLDAAFDQDGGKSLVTRSKKKKDIGFQNSGSDAEEGNGGGAQVTGGWGMYVDPDTETSFYYHSGRKMLQASLPPADAHGMDQPPSALGNVGRALAQGKMDNQQVKAIPPPEIEAALSLVDVPAALMTKLARVQRERVPYEERRTHLRVRQINTGSICKYFVVFFLTTFLWFSLPLCVFFSFVVG